MENMKIKLLLVVLFITTSVGCFQTINANEFNAKVAWHELEGVIKQQYAYIDRPDFNVEVLFQEFERRALDTKSQKEFADLSQMFLRNFCDPHLNLGPYDENDFSVFPTGSDIRAVYINDKFIIEDIKANAAADLAGMRVGFEILAIDDLSVTQSIENVFGKKFNKLSLKQINYGLNVSLGGFRNNKRTIKINNQGILRTYQLAASYDSIQQFAKGDPVTYKQLSDGVGYIRINNSLGNSNTVEFFKEAITALFETKALIIDLRNTPSGGNTGVAEPILGHFVDKKTAYQLYQQQESGLSYKDAQMTTAYAEPTLPHYTKPFVVLAGRWTGSMGEGMTIGFDALGAKTVIGAPMADLLGGIKTVQLNESSTWLELAFERLYHVNNTFREDFVPHISINPTDRDVKGEDPALLRAQQFIAELGTHLD